MGHLFFFHHRAFHKFFGQEKVFQQDKKIIQGGFSYTEFFTCVLVEKILVNNFLSGENFPNFLENLEKFSTKKKTATKKLRVVTPLKHVELY